MKSFVNSLPKTLLTKNQRLYSDLNAKQVLIGRIINPDTPYIDGPATVFINGLRSSIIYNGELGVSWLAEISGIRGTLTDCYSKRDEYSQNPEHTPILESLEDSNKKFPRFERSKFIKELVIKYLLSHPNLIPHNETENVAPCLKTLGLFITAPGVIESKEFKQIENFLSKELGITNPPVRIYNPDSGGLGELLKSGEITPLREATSIQEVLPFIQNKIPKELVERYSSSQKFFKKNTPPTHLLHPFLSNIPANTGNGRF